jgi:hypothetical protein
MGYPARCQASTPPLSVRLFAKPWAWNRAARLAALASCGQAQ